MAGLKTRASPYVGGPTHSPISTPSTIAVPASQRARHPATIRFCLSGPPSAVLSSGHVRTRPPRQCQASALFTGRDLITGDALLLIAFCIYKQLASIVLSPSFPGWLAPLEFSPTRCTELVGFIITVAGTWVACGMLNGDYSDPAKNMQQALQKTCRTWITSTPVMAAQLVLATAAESGSLVLDDRFTDALPLAATGVGEPFASAAGILGGMLVWRTFYTGFLDWSSFLSYNASSKSQDEAKAWSETLALVAVLVVLCASAAALAGYKVGGTSWTMVKIL